MSILNDGEGELLPMTHSFGPGVHDSSLKAHYNRVVEGRHHGRASPAAFCTRRNQTHHCTSRSFSVTSVRDAPYLVATGARACHRHPRLADTHEDKLIMFSKLA